MNKNTSFLKELRYTEMETKKPRHPIPSKAIMPVTICTDAGQTAQPRDVSRVPSCNQPAKSVYASGIQVRKRRIGSKNSRVGIM